MSEKVALGNKACWGYFLSMWQDSWIFL